MHSDSYFIQALIYLVAAIISVPVMKKLGLGSVLGFLLAGVIIGPFGFDSVGSAEQIMHFAEFGVVMMLFVIGLELEPAKLWNLRMPIVGLGGSQLALTAGLITCILYFFGLPWQQGLAIGLIFALSSTAIAMQSLEETGGIKTQAGRNSFSVLLFQDLAVIPLISIFPLLAIVDMTVGGGESHSQSSLALGLATIVAIIIIGKFVSRPLFRFIASSGMREIFTATTLCIVVAAAVAMIEVGLSPALGTFIAGVVLADSEYRHELESTLEPFKALLLGLFFIAIGASINFAFIAENLLLTLGAVAALILFKMLVLAFLGKLAGQSFSQNRIFTFVLSQAGEFGFVLTTFALQKGVLPAELVDALMAIIALSMLTTPVLMFIDSRILTPRLNNRSETEAKYDSPDQGGVIVAGYGRFGQIVSRLLRANGFDTVLLDHNPRQIERVKKFGIKVFYGDAARLDLLEAAGAKKARLLVIAIDQKDKVLPLVKEVKSHFPNLTIMARAHDRMQAFELRALGVRFIYRETFDSALGMGEDALRVMGFRAHQAHRHAMLFKHHDEKNIEELFEIYSREGASEAFIAEAKKRTNYIDQIIESDRANSESVKVDHAFDCPRQVLSKTS